MDASSDIEMDASSDVDTRAREAGGVASTPPPSLAVLALGIGGGLLLMAAEFMAIASVDVASGACEVINDANPQLADRCSLSGFERHGGAFLLLGALAVAMAVGAGRRRSRPAAAALIAFGAIALAIALVRDLPETRQTGAIGQNFEGARAVAGPGLYLEIAAGALLAAGGALSLARRR